MRIYEGSILTCDRQNHVYQYLVENNGRIVYVGNELPAEFANETRVKLGDRALIPAFGASNHSVEEKQFVSRTQLDTVCPDKPLFMIKYDGHTCVVNTKLLNILKEKVKDLRGYHEDTGEMNQEAFFKFSDYVSSSIPPVKLLRNMQIAADYLAGKGIGMITCNSKLFHRLAK